MSNSVIFRLRGIRVRGNHRVAVVGSSSNLGSWIPRKTCFLEKSAEDMHELRIVLDDPIAEYKYVILSGSEIQWEGGQNRVIDTTVGNGECNDTWISTGASEFVARTDAGDVPEARHNGSPEVRKSDAVLKDDTELAQKTALKDDTELAQKTATKAHEGSSLGDRDVSEAEVNGNSPDEEKLSPKKEQKHQSDAKSKQNCEVDSGNMKKPSGETPARRTPFFLINTIFKLCRKRVTNTN